MLRRATEDDIPAINEIMNHPSVYKGATLGRDIGPMDVTHAFKALYVLLLESGHGCIILDPYSSTTGEVHTCLKPEARGPGSDKIVMEALRFFFGELALHKLFTRVLVANKPADLFARQAGFVRISDTGEIRSYILPRERWPQVDEELGAILPPALDGILDDTHFRKVLGAACLLGMKGWMGNAVSFYNEHARLHGYPTMEVTTLDSVMVGGRLIHFDVKNTFRVEEMPCLLDSQSPER